MLSCLSNSENVIEDGQRETEIEGIENESLNHEKALNSFIASTIFKVHIIKGEQLIQHILHDDAEQKDEEAEIDNSYEKFVLQNFLLFLLILSFPRLLPFFWQLWGFVVAQLIKVECAWENKTKINSNLESCKYYNGKQYSSGAAIIPHVWVTGDCLLQKKLLNCHCRCISLCCAFTTISVCFKAMIIIIVEEQLSNN